MAVRSPTPTPPYYHPTSSSSSQDAEVPKLELPTLEENGICEDRDCPGPPKSLSPKSGPTSKGQAGDGPGLESAELPLPLETEHHNAMELEKVRMEFELTRLKFLHQENERQRQHEEVMEQLQQQQQQQALPRQVYRRAGCGPWLYQLGYASCLLAPGLTESW